MSKRARAVNRRAGFTLPEILVAVAMVGVLAAVTLPAVMSQVNKSEISRVVQDLQAIGQASQLYRTDVGEWPASTNELITSVEVGWTGPYLARTTTGAILTGAGGTIVEALEDGVTPSGAAGPFLEISVTGLTLTDALSVDLQIDAGETGDWWSTGLVRAGSSTDTNLKFYPVAIK